MRYPMMVDLSQREIKIVGGGEVARRKALSLKNYSKEITIIAPKIHEDLKFANCIYSDDPIKYLSLGDFVIICTDNEGINQRVKDYCKKEKLWYLLATSQGESEIIFPALLDLGDLQFSVSTNGIYPALARKIKEDLLEKYSKYDEEYMKELKEFRKIVLESNLDRALLYEVLDLNLDELREYIGRYK